MPGSDRVHRGRRPSGRVLPGAYDVVVVGARCGGSTLAALLADAGRRVLVVDHATTLTEAPTSTHVLFPHTLARFSELGVLAAIAAQGHRINPVRFSWRVLGHEVAGSFSAVDGHQRAACIRRSVLDPALVDVATRAGAELRLGAKVTGLVGSGAAGDPVRGVRLDDGEEISARWVVGADGRRSTVARLVGAGDADPRAAAASMMYAYWRGFPATDWCRIDAQEHLALMSVPCEDDLHLLAVSGPPHFTRGTARERGTRYRAALADFPAALGAADLAAAERVSEVLTAPETMLRGHARRATGPGWVLIGDAGRFSHPATAQGIGDAVEQAHYLADLIVEQQSTAGFQEWRDEGADHYAWSYRAALFPTPPSERLFAGVSGDPVASQQFLDTFTRRRRPDEVFTPERVTDWLSVPSGSASPAAAT